MILRVYASRFWCEWGRVSGDNPVAFYVPLLEEPQVKQYASLTIEAALSNTTKSTEVCA
jgi:hypothetical protein